MSKRPILGERLTVAVVRRPFADEHGRKGWLERWSRAQPHVIARHALTIPGWPKFQRPLRIVFLSDLHFGSHADDVARHAAIAAEASALAPDLVLFGGDYMNMQIFGGGRVPPRIIAGLMVRIEAPLGRFAILGNHDYCYGADDVTAAWREHGVPVLDHQSASIAFGGHRVDIAGLPDAHQLLPQGHVLLAGLSRQQPAIVLAHDPAWFAHVPAGPFLTMSGHTHGGQIRLPGIGILKNSSTAPLRWSHGHIVEEGRHLFVTAGLGTSGIPLRIGVPPEFAVLDVTG